LGLDEMSWFLCCNLQCDKQKKMLYIHMAQITGSSLNIRSVKFTVTWELSIIWAVCVEHFLFITLLLSTI